MQYRNHQSMLKYMYVPSYLIDYIRRLESSSLRFPDHIWIAPAVRPKHVDIERHFSCSLQPCLSISSSTRKARDVEGQRRCVAVLRAVLCAASCGSASPCSEIRARRCVYVPMKMPSRFWFIFCDSSRRNRPNNNKEHR